jgi:hypothetical protein
VSVEDSDDEFGLDEATQQAMLDEGMWTVHSIESAHWRSRPYRLVILLAALELELTW